MGEIVYWITYYAAVYGINANLALAVVSVESGFVPTKIGSIGERGLFQVRPEYASVSKDSLLNVKVNIKEGIRKLAEAKRLCKHKLDNTFIVCYNAGVTGGSRLKWPKKFHYYKKVQAAMAEFKIGQQVVVLKAFSSGHYAVGTIMRKLTDKANKDKWLVDITETSLAIEEERLVDADTFFRRK